MSQKQSPRWKRWTVRWTLAAWLVCQAVPAWSAPRERRAPTRIGDWIEQAIGQAMARWTRDGRSADDPGDGAIGSADTERIRARQRHHLTIEPGGDALPPPPDEGGAPNHG